MVNSRPLSFRPRCAGRAWRSIHCGCNCSCHDPHLLRSRTRITPQRHGGCRSVSQRDPLFSMFSASGKLRLYDPPYKYAAAYSIDWTHLSRAHSSMAASFLKTFRAEGNLRLACSLRLATAKTSSTLDFLHCAATARSGLRRGCASKILSQFDDSHFCNM